MIEIEDICEPEWAAWYRMTPQERWEESARLWHHYVAMGGSLDPEPDPQSPFYDPETSGRAPVDGRPGLRVREQERLVAIWIVDVNYLSYRDEPTPERIDFWLRELRTPELLVETAQAHSDLTKELAKARPLLDLATPEGLESGALAQALRDEEETERRLDAAYWKPLREQLERIRFSRRPVS